MSDKYKIWDQRKAYFLTLTVEGWIDIFSRRNHKLTVINSLKYCQKEKGLVIFGYCLMPSHLHLISRTEGDFTLSDILRDFKKFTSKAMPLLLKYSSIQSLLLSGSSIISLIIR